MTPLLSWITIILALTFVGLLLRWLSEVEQRIDARLRARDAAKSNSADDTADATGAPLAQVLKLTPAVSQRHLSLVPAPAREGSEDLYDWRVQGL